MAHDPAVQIHAFELHKENMIPGGEIDGEREHAHCRAHNGDRHHARKIKLYVENYKRYDIHNTRT